MAQRMAHRLAARRRREFVGRAAELALFTRLLADVDGGSVVFVSGPGGVGKTTLLGQVAWLGEQAGRRVVRLDGREVPPVGSAFLMELASQAGCGADPDPLASLGTVEGLLLLVDTGERLALLDRWLREELLPGLAADAIVVLAGREPPSVAWQTDPGWRGLLHAVRLENLSREESMALLERRGCPEDRLDDALAFTRGHPLALALVADVVAQGAARLAPAELPGVVGPLLATLVDTVPSPLHRRALEACAQVLTTTEPLLAALLDLPDAHEMFDWLRGLSVVETGPRGLFPHDVARDALVAELRWRHPEQYADIHRRAGAYYRRQFYAVPTGQQQQVLVEYVYLHRDNPVLGPFVTDSTQSGMDLRALVATPATVDERDLVREIVRTQEGVESAALAGYWMERQPGSLLLVRGPDGEVLGLIGTLTLTGVSADDRRRDRAVDQVCAFLDTRMPLAAGDTAGFFRFWMQREGYQELGPVQLFITLHFVRYYLSTPNLAYSFVYYADPDLWAGICAYSDMTRLADADFVVGGRRYGVYGHDWQRTPPLAWLELLGDREVGHDDPAASGAARAGVPGAPERLSDAAFAAAVKAALNGLGRADGLRDSPLLRSPLVTSRVPPDAGDRERGEALRALIEAAAAGLEASPRDRRGFRAVHHTYLQPAPTQAAAAELLDLPTTTYRRHLTVGITRLTQILRQEDLDAG